MSSGGLILMRVIQMISFALSRKANIKGSYLNRNIQETSNVSECVREWDRTYVECGMKCWLVGELNEKIERKKIVIVFFFCA